MVKVPIVPNIEHLNKIILQVLKQHILHLNNMLLSHQMPQKLARGINMASFNFNFPTDETLQSQTTVSI